jgi:hypothetical protein
MSQATLLGICSDNVVTILTPSSTIECGPFADAVSTTTVAAGPSVDTLVFSLLPLYAADQVLVTGSLQIMFTVVPAAWTTAPPLTYLQVQLGSDPATVINRYVIFHYYSGSYSPVPVDLQFTFLATGPTTVTVTPMNAGGPVTLQGSLWYQTAQI